MVDRVKEGGRAPTTLTSLEWNDGMYTRKRPLPLCLFSVEINITKNNTILKITYRYNQQSTEPKAKYSFRETVPLNYERKISMM
jgi:hypothetical protein